jgi:hypothetical protein
MECENLGGSVIDGGNDIDLAIFVLERFQVLDLLTQGEST